MLINFFDELEEIVEEFARDFIGDPMTTDTRIRIDEAMRDAISDLLKIDVSSVGVEGEFKDRAYQIKKITLWPQHENPAVETVKVANKLALVEDGNEGN